jgi:quinoprotein glucose dehydrogenase
MALINRRQLLATSSAAVLLGPGVAKAQPAAAPRDTDWRHWAADLASTRFAPLDQINASNFNQMEVAWRFSTDAFGPQLDAYYNCTPLVVKGRLYATAGTGRYAVALDAGTGQLLWSYLHDEKGRSGTRQGAGFGLSYWTDGTAERILYVTRSYQLISLDARTGEPDPTFGVNGELDLRLDWDQDVDPTRGVTGLHAAPLIVKDTVVVGAAPSTFVRGYLRAFDVRTGKRKWIFHTIPQKGEVGYDTWIKPGQAEAASNTSVWAPMSADPELGLIYAGVELPATDVVGVTRHGNSLFSETLVALDVETGQRRWHFQLEHHGLWDRDVPCAATLFDLVIDGKPVKALAQASKQGFLYVLDRVTGKPIWPIVERPVPKGDVPGEWYSPTQPVPTKPPAFSDQGLTLDSFIDYTPELKARALEIVSKYKLGTSIFTPPALTKESGPWGTLLMPGSHGGANWPGGSYDPETGMYFIYGKNTPEASVVFQNPDGTIGGNNGRPPYNTNDNGGSTFGSTASLRGGAVGLGGPPPPGYKDGLNDPITPQVLNIEGIPIVKPPYGRIVAFNLKTGEKVWQVAHGETPDNLKNHPLLKGLNLPRTGQGGLLGVLTTRSLVICGDSGLFTDEQGRKGARLRAYDKATGREVGAVFMDKAQSGPSMTYMHAGRQYIVSTNGSTHGAELIAFRLPVAAPARPPQGPRPNQQN